MRSIMLKISVTILFIALPFYLSSKIKRRKRSLIVCSYLLLFLEGLRMGIPLFYHQFHLSYDLPVHLCFLSTYFICFIVFFRKSILIPYCQVFLPFLGIMAILLFPTIQFGYAEVFAYLYHSLLILAGILLNYEYQGQCHLSSVMFLFYFQIGIAWLFNHFLNGSNYMFLNTIFYPSNQSYHDSQLFSLLDKMAIFSHLSFLEKQLTTNGYHLILLFCMLLVGLLLLFIRNVKYGEKIH